MKKQKLSPFEKYIYVSIPAILIVSLGLCGAYEASGKSESLAVFVPINASVWETLKLIIYPILISWLIAYFLRFKIKISKPQAVFGAALSVGITPVLAVGMYYFYICAFGIYSETINFFIVTLSVIVGQIAAHSACCYLYPAKTQAAKSFAFLIAVIIMIAICTYNPPKLPLFMDPETGSYGIYKLMD